MLPGQCYRDWSGSRRRERGGQASVTGARRFARAAASVFQRRDSASGRSMKREGGGRIAVTRLHRRGCDPAIQPLPAGAGFAAIGCSSSFGLPSARGKPGLNPDRQISWVLATRTSKYACVLHDADFRLAEGLSAGSVVQSYAVRLRCRNLPGPGKCQCRHGKGPSRTGDSAAYDAPAKGSLSLLRKATGTQLKILSRSELSGILLVY